MAKSKARMMFDKYPKLFMDMYLHSLEENPNHPDDNSIIFSKIMMNVAVPGTYWMPEDCDVEAVLNDFRQFVINQ